MVLVSMRAMCIHTKTELDQKVTRLKQAALED